MTIQQQCHCNTTVVRLAGFVKRDFKKSEHLTGRPELTGRQNVTSAIQLKLPFIHSVHARLHFGHVTPV